MAHCSAHALSRVCCSPRQLTGPAPFAYTLARCVRCSPRRLTGTASDVRASSPFVCCLYRLPTCRSLLMPRTWPVQQTYSHRVRHLYRLLTGAGPPDHACSPRLLVLTTRWTPVRHCRTAKLCASRDPHATLEPLTSATTRFPTHPIRTENHSYILSCRVLLA